MGNDQGAMDASWKAGTAELCFPGGWISTGLRWLLDVTEKRWLDCFVISTLTREDQPFWEVFGSRHSRLVSVPSAEHGERLRAATRCPQAPLGASS